MSSFSILAFAGVLAFIAARAIRFAALTAHLAQAVDLNEKLLRENIRLKSQIRQQYHQLESRLGKVQSKAESAVGTSTAVPALQEHYD